MLIYHQIKFKLIKIMLVRYGAHYTTFECKLASGLRTAIW